MASTAGGTTEVTSLRGHDSCRLGPACSGEPVHFQCANCFALTGPKLEGTMVNHSFPKEGTVLQNTGGD